MAVSPDFRDYVLELLEPLGEVTARAMFGGAGIYMDGSMFALIANETLFFKTDDINRPDFEAEGMAPFSPYADKPQMTMSYSEVPAHLMEDSDGLCEWATRAWEAARRNPPKKKAKKKKPKTKKARK
ncbi:MAG: TfoX/Sxy family protein [Rhodospirillaceae bacterium]|nr:TfoX/Sxy family protein [Rhodospirillaceae bacterium]